MLKLPNVGKTACRKLNEKVMSMCDAKFENKTLLLWFAVSYHYLPDMGRMARTFIFESEWLELRTIEIAGLVKGKPV